jgi:hypothetical protein
MRCGIFIFKSQKLIFSHDNESFYHTIRKRHHFVIKYSKPYLRKCFSVKVIGYLSLSVIKTLVTSSPVRLFLMITSTAIHRQE